MKKRRVLPQEVLKLIACITMLIDHVGASMYPDNIWLRMIGRVAFPIYCFLLTEGMRKTSNPRRYLVRLFCYIFLAEQAFDYLFFNGFTWDHQSVMVTLFLGGCMLHAQNNCKQNWLKVLLALVFAILAELCKCDYGGYGIAVIAVFALTKKWYYRLLLLLILNLGNTAEYVVKSLPSFWNANWQTWAAIKRILWVRPPIQFLSVTALIPISLYSGKKLSHSKALQLSFYLFYPVHLALLVIFVNYLL